MSSMIRIVQKGDFKKTEKFLNEMSKKKYLQVMNKYGQKGAQALASATPVDTGKTAASWGYEIHGSSIYWTNDNINKGVNIAVILQYGHGTRNGGYVQGRDYINPAIRSIFDAMIDEIWKEVTSA